MVYATSQDMVTAFGESEVIQLTTGSLRGDVIDDDVLKSALIRASSEIDSYVGGRYQLPLSPDNIPAALVDRCCDIARYKLAGSGGKRVTEESRLRYEDAIRYLERVASGAIKLGIGSAGSPLPGNSACFIANDSQFSRDKTRGGGVLIVKVENAIIQRLIFGLGDMVRQVSSYGGEFDAGLDTVIGSLPAAWVTFAGIQNTTQANTSRVKHLVTARFAVLVADYNVRNEQSSRHGGELSDEVGTYNLIYAVRRLLSGQDLGLSMQKLMPGRVRTLFNTQVENQALSVFACEFDTQWHDTVLANGHWPAPESDNEPDSLFAYYNGHLDNPAPLLKTVGTQFKTEQFSVNDDILLKDDV